MVNGIVSLISLSYLSLLVYGNAEDSELILNAASLPNSLISSNTFLVISLEFSMYCIMSSENSNNYTSSLLIWNTFFFSYSDFHIKTSKTILSNSGKNAHFCLIHDSTGNA